MRPRRAPKPVTTAELAATTPNSILTHTITLGEELSKDTDGLASPSPANPTEHTYQSYPSPPLPPNNTESATPREPSPSSDAEDEKEGLNRLDWTEEMHEQLVEVLHQVFEDGRAADNGFKKAAFEKAAVKVRQVYNGVLEITHGKCKNKWSDTKRKWAHWIFLSKQSGIGFNPDTELYEAYDYVWDALNRSHPKIIWHKTHVMPFRDIIGYILHDVQANGQGALTLEVLTPVDPRLKALDSTAALYSTSPAPIPLPTTAKTPYNKSKKRIRAEDGDESDKGTVALKKVDLGVAISGLSEELRRARRAKEEYLTNQQKAVQLLEREYKTRLEMMAFIDGCEFLQHEGNAVTFITLTDPQYRDRWLEVKLGTELLLPS
jgi:Myb/SANT-like DNA-binding domain